ncbi:hypothetical protein MIDIC_150006 [Alphaproteobacteria bacterium]
MLDFFIECRGVVYIRILHLGVFGLNESMKALQPGNTLVVWKLDRLGRSLKHLVQICATYTTT